MNGRQVAEHLAAAGLDERELAAKADLFERTLRAFKATAEGDPDLALWIPGRLEVFGTHTDYAGGQSLVAALPRGFAFAAKRRSDRTLHIVDARNDEALTLDTGEPLPGLRGWRHYVEVVVDRLTRNFPHSDVGADLVFASDLPRAAGMSSSSALIVGVASALTRLSDIRERVEWRREIPGRLEEAGYYACIENGRSFGRLHGHEGVGTHGGSEDHAAMLCGIAGSVTCFSFVPMRQVGVARMPGDWQFVVASSGVAAEKTGAALVSYNRLADDVAALLHLWNTHEHHAPSLAAVVASSPDAAKRLEKYVAASGGPGLGARLDHFVRENARVPLALSAFERGDTARLATFACDSQRDSETLLLNQVPQTMALTQLALEAGAFAARSFGAGFGGSVWALIERAVAATFAQEWLDAYQRRFSDNRPVVFPASPAPSLSEYHHR